MKKFLSLAAITVFGALCLTACGGSGNKIVCKGTESGEGMDITSEVTATIKDDKVSDLSASMTFDSEDTASQYAAILKMAEAYVEGSDFGISTKGKTITINNMASLLEIQSSSDAGSEKIIGATKDEFIEYFEKQGYSCK